MLLRCNQGSPNGKSLLFGEKQEKLAGDFLSGMFFAMLIRRFLCCFVSALALAYGGGGIPSATATEQPALSSPWMADLTWLELRTAMERGVNTAILPLGGIEARGSHLVLGANNAVLTHIATQAARQDGATVIAPVLPFAPEISEEDLGTLRWPGTLHISPDSIASAVAEVAASLKIHGIHHLVLLTNQTAAANALRETAQALNKTWAVEGVVVGLADVSRDESFETSLLARFGIPASDAGDHGGVIETAEMLACCSEGVRQSTLPRTPAAVEASGASGRPDRATSEIGRESLSHKVSVVVSTVNEVRAVAAEILADQAAEDAKEAAKSTMDKKEAPNPE